MPYTGRVTIEAAAIYAPNIPTFLLKKERKPTMLFNLRKRFISWLRETDQDQVEEDKPRGVSVNSWNNLATVKLKTKASVSGNNPELDSRGVRFTVYPARGGVVVETTSYDPKTDHSKVSLHVVPEDEELDVALANIITIETLRSQ